MVSIFSTFSPRLVNLLGQLHLRRFLLSPQAVELFWADSPEVFLAFEDVNDRQAFTRVLRKQNLPMIPALTRRGTLHPRKVLNSSWKRWFGLETCIGRYIL